MERKINPFIDRYDHEMIGKEREEEVTRIVNVIENNSARFTNFETAQPVIAIIKAGYGIGKTFTAFNIKEKLINNKDYAVSYFKLIDDQQKGYHLNNNKFYNKVIKNITLSNKNNELDLTQYSDIDKEVDNILVDTCKTLYTNKIKNLVVIIDEVEDLLTTGTQKTIIFLTMLRNIYDIFTENYSKGEKITPVTIILLLSPDAWSVVEHNSEKTKTKNAGAGLTPLISRIGNNIFELREFNRKDVNDYIVMILNKSRKKSNEIKPFTREVIDKIHVITRGNPRRILTNCYDMLNMMYDKDTQTLDIELFNEFCRINDIEQSELEVDDEDIEKAFGKF